MGPFRLSLRGLVIFFSLLCFVLQLHAQQPPAAPTPPPGQVPQGAGNPDAQSGTAGPRKQVATIIFAALGGAILGLSTLSFYGRPQDHLVNMAIGGAFGAIVGTMYVTYQAATRPQEFFGEHAEIEEQMYRDQHRGTAPTPPPAFAYQWQF